MRWWCRIHARAGSQLFRAGSTRHQCNTGRCEGLVMHKMLTDDGEGRGNYEFDRCNGRPTLCQKSIGHGGLIRLTNVRPIWRRAPRTRAALAMKAEAIKKAVRILDEASVTYTQPLFGKLVVEPPPTIQRGKSVTFWPARERLRVAQRPTRVGQDIVAFQQALADQGHRIPGYVSRRPRPSWSAKLSSAERLRARREAELVEMEQAHAQLIGLAS